ncbi:MAG: hypothetical protein E7318_10095 [Clostridiales bacterium]|nr:hypothetical protein [Clostridiales bacterium]
MTRWQRFCWALGYTMLTVFGVFMWMYATDTGVFNCLGATSLIYGLGVGAYAENELIGGAMFILFLTIGAGLLIVPVLTAFNLKVPVYVLMGLDVLGRIILIVNKALDRDAYMLGEIILGLIVSIGVLAGTIRMFRQPEKTAEAQVL